MRDSTETGSIDTLMDAIGKRARAAARRLALAPTETKNAALLAMADALAFFSPDMPVVRFPAWDCLPYDRVSPNPDISAARMATLADSLLSRIGRPSSTSDATSSLGRRARG